MPALIKCNKNSVLTDISIQNATVNKDFVAMHGHIDIATGESKTSIL